MARFCHSVFVPVLVIEQNFFPLWQSSDCLENYHGYEQVVQLHSNISLMGIFIYRHTEYFHYITEHNLFLFTFFSSYPKSNWPMSRQDHSYRACTDAFCFACVCTCIVSVKGNWTGGRTDHVFKMMQRFRPEQTNCKFENRQISLFIIPS